MSNTLLIGAAVAVGGILLYRRMKAKAAPAASSGACDAMCALAEKTTGVPASACKEGVTYKLCKSAGDFFGEHPFVCPAGTVQAEDHRASNLLDIAQGKSYVGAQLGSLVNDAMNRGNFAKGSGAGAAVSTCVPANPAKNMPPLVLHVDNTQDLSHAHGGVSVSGGTPR